LNSDVPDPFKLVRRIHALEIAARQLQEACLDIAEKRKKLSPAVIDQQEENNDVLNHVCIVW
jgi:fibrillarin-like rRNA methylase